MRAILFLLMIIGIFLLIRFTLARINQFKREQSLNESEPNSTAQNKTAEMVKCQTCGVHLPKSEAISTEKGFFCSTHCEQKAD